MIKNNLHVNIFSVEIHSFHFYGVLGFIFGTVLGVIIASLLHLNFLSILLLSAIGAASFFGLTFLSKLTTGNEVIVYYHHEIFILVVCAVTLTIMKLPVLQYLDITLIGIGVFLGFGRIGCYSVGCCHGRPHKHGVRYGQQHVDAGFTWYYKAVPLLPVQLIESAFVFLTVIAGIILLFNQVQPGTVLIVYTVVYGLMRYILEFFRGDPERPLFHGVSEAQWTSLLLTAVTYMMAVIKWLPSYNWHLIMLGLQIGITATTILWFKRYRVKRLFNPRQIKELANGLNMLEELNDKKDKQNAAVDVYATGEGLCISCGRLPDQKNLKHYTISLKNKRRFIEIINHHSVSYNIIEK